ncbi:O-antigen ligase family protein [Paraclostridium bifermentans]|uniref:O-antigen ligase family protein n=1 Tax=Paraclostridium bifermentans TaxID=1490 RepID=UPI0025B0B2E2|nr:O-antigen ligase family protein [Paraclostridium bifermentans]
MNITKKNKITNLEMILFVIGIVLQCFSITQVGGSGIPFLFCICLMIYIKHRLYSKINMFFTMIITLMLIRVTTDILFIGSPMFSIVRLVMIIFIIYVSFKYIEIIYREDRQGTFYKIYMIVFILLNLYGIYSIFSKKFNLPLFMNIFINNPSYAVKENMFTYVSGWVQDMRIYATFSEPSFYAFFLCMNLLIVKNINTKLINKIIINILIIINLYSTYSRSGYVMYIQLIVIMVVYKSVSKLLKSRKYTYNILLIIVLLIPFINLGIMDFANRNVFNDLSSESRTKSGIYYLKESLKDTKSITIGHGYKSISLGYNYILKNDDIEGFAHNAYIEIIYELGWIFFLILMGIIVFFINKNIKLHEYRLQIFAIIATMSSSVAFYNIESIISLLVVFIGSAVNSRYKKFNITNEIKSEGE